MSRQVARRISSLRSSSRPACVRPTGPAFRTSTTRARVAVDLTLESEQPNAYAESHRWIPPITPLGLDIEPTRLAYWTRSLTDSSVKIAGLRPRPTAGPIPMGRPGDTAMDLTYTDRMADLKARAAELTGKIMV